MNTNPPNGRAGILLVEDDADVRLVVRGFLESSGYQVWEAANGREAMNVWKTTASQIDLLLTDLIMPGGLTGWELADKLRAERPNLRVILMSGYCLDEAGKIQLFSYILQKPFTFENLTEIVRNCLDTPCLPRREI
jgi:CheY-like chemotaxis protein